MRIKMSFLLIVLHIAAFVHAQRIEFFREDISFGIDTTFFTVNGDYYFRNSSDNSHSIVIAYPVRSNGTLKPIDTIMVFDESDMAHALKVEVKDTVATFAVKIPPHSFKTLKIIYRQRHNGKEARYILLTTKFWDKPLEIANYNLVIQKNIRINDFSIKPDNSVDFGNTMIYYWKREQFMPAKDFEIKFNPKG
ncbi:MAG: hypothetical protein WCM93_10100 [Bacteroidota bacterium]